VVAVHDGQKTKGAGLAGEKENTVVSSAYTPLISIQHILLFLRLEQQLNKCPFEHVQRGL